MKILVVDDEPDVASLISMGIHFHRPDHEVVEVDCTGTGDPVDVDTLDDFRAVEGRSA